MNLLKITLAFFAVIFITPVAQANTTVPIVTSPNSDDDGDFSVTWTPVPNAVRYELWENSTRKYIGENLSFNRSRLSKGTYSYVVKACISGQGCGFESNPSTTTVYIPAPTINSPATDSDGTYTVYWSQEAYVKRYELLENNQRIFSGSGTSITRTQSEGSYTYKVRMCRDGQGCGPYSNETSVNVTYIPAPNITAPSEDDDGVYDVSWSTVSNVVRYELFENGSKIYSGPNSTFSLNNQPGHYEYQVKACRSGQGCTKEPNSITVVVLPPVEKVLGSVASVTTILDKVKIEGWSCHSHVAQSNSVDIYVEKSGTSEFLGSFSANIPHNNSLISSECGTSGVQHGFQAELNSQVLVDNGLTGGTLKIYGSSVDASLPDELLANCSNCSIPEVVLQSLANIPGSGGNIIIGADQDVTMLSGAYDFGDIVVNGKLRCPSSSSNIVLKARSIMIHGDQAIFECGTVTSPFQGEFNILIKHNPDVLSDTMRIMVMHGATISLHGEGTGKKWGLLTAHANENDLSIEVESDLVVKKGDTIVIASTSFDFMQSEKRVVDKEPVENGATKSLNFEISGTPLEYNHIGQTHVFQDTGETLDMRANIAVLNRNIKISTDSPIEADLSKRGADMMIMSSSKAYISSVQFDRMGNMGKLGRYPFHWHRTGVATGQYIKDSSITNSYQRCIVIHATNGALVENNVCYNHFGHGYFLEEGHETNNRLLNNISIQAKKPIDGRQLLHSENQIEHPLNPLLTRFAPTASFWISNPSNEVVGNVAAGYEGTGFWMAFSARLLCIDNPLLSPDTQCKVPEKDKPEFPGFDYNYWPSRTPTPPNWFRDNRAYSGLVGFTWDGAPDGEPTDPNNPEPIRDRVTRSSHYYGYASGDPVKEFGFPNLTAFRNVNSGLYYRGTQAAFDNFTGADNGVSIFVAYAQRFINSLIVGESVFLTDAERIYQWNNSDWSHGLNGVYYKKKMKGFVTYDGPSTLKNVHFAGFPADKMEYLHYYSDNKLPDDYDLTPSPIHIFGGSTHYEHQADGIRFEGQPYYKVNFNYDHNAGWQDVVNHVRVRDVDGSIYGIAGGLIVPDEAILNDPKCRQEVPTDHAAKLAQSNVLVCDDDYDLGVFWLRNVQNSIGKTENGLDFTATRNDGAQYGPRINTYKNNNKVGLIMDGYSYTVELNSTEGLSQIPVLFEHAEKNIASPLVTLKGVSHCLIDDPSKGVAEQSELSTQTSSAFYKDNSNGVYVFRFVTVDAIRFNESAYRSQIFTFTCP